MKKIEKNVKNYQIGDILFDDFSASPRLNLGSTKLPIGVIVSVNQTNNIAKAIALESSAVPQIWSFGYNELSPLSEKICRIGQLDFDGEKNTARIIANAKKFREEKTLKLKENPEFCVSAAAYCANYQTIGTTSGDWYLGAIDEMLEIEKNFFIINKALARCNMELLHLDTEYWSSTEFSYEEVRCYVPKDKHPLALYYTKPKECLASVLPMIALQGS